MTASSQGSAIAEPERVIVARQTSGALRAWFVDAIGWEEGLDALESVLWTLGSTAAKPRPRAQVAALLRDLEVTARRLSSLGRLSGHNVGRGRDSVSHAVELAWAVEHVATEGLRRLHLQPEPAAAPLAGLRESYAIAFERVGDGRPHRRHLELLVRSVFEAGRGERRQPSEGRAPVAAELAAAEAELEHLAEVAGAIQAEIGDGSGEPPAEWRTVLTLLPGELSRLASQAGEGVAHG